MRRGHDPVRRRDEKWTIDDDGTAVRLAGRPTGWHERADRIAESAGVKVSHRGIVFVPAVGESQIDRLVALIAATSLEVYDAPLDER